MPALFITLGILAILCIATLLIAYLTYRIAFHSPDRHQNDIHYIPLDGISEEKRKKMHQMIDYFDTLAYERVTTRAFDGLTLSARYIHRQDGAPCAICCHGYRGTSIRDFCGGGQIPLSRGHNLLLIDQRACHESEGHAITFGIKERYDVLSWIDYVRERFGRDTEIELFGVSMGAATVLLTCALDLPENVRHIIADSPYTSPKEIILKVCREDMHIPPRLAYPFLALGARLFAGIDIREGDVTEAVKHSPVDILLIHGESDGFVPTEMSHRIAASAPDRITLHTFPDAIHALSFTTDKERYLKIANAYLDKDRRRKEAETPEIS